MAGQLDAPKELDKDKLNDVWTSSLDKARTKAKKDGEEAAFKTLEKALGNGLKNEIDAFSDAFDDIDVMIRKKKLVDSTLKGWKSAVRGSDVGDGAAKLLEAGLKATKQAVEKAFNKADTAVTLHGKRSVKPIKLLETSNLGKAVEAKASINGDALIDIKALNIKITLTDEDCVRKLDDDDARAAQKLVDAANYQQVVADIAAGYAKIHRTHASSSSPVDEAKFRKQLEEVTKAAGEAAMDRATDEARRICGVRNSYKAYKFETGVKIASTAAGAALGTASLALAPFQGPAMALTLLGVVKGYATVARDIYTAAREGGAVLESLQKKVARLEIEFDKAYGNKNINASELAWTTIETLLPVFPNTISSCLNLCGVVGSKIDGMDVLADKLSRKLTRALDQQRSIQQSFDVFERSLKENRKKLLTANKKQTKAFEKASKAFDKAKDELEAHAKVTGQVLKSIDELVGKLARARKEHKVLERKLQLLDDRKAPAEKVAENLIGIGASVGFLASANAGWPDAYNCAATAKTVIDHVGNAVGVADGVKGVLLTVEDLADDVNDA